MHRLLIVAAAAAILVPGTAQAAAPIMPLRDVQPGMRCTGLSVVKGLTISSFTVDVLDVLDAQRLDAARILVRASGPAVDATGLGAGFSGSPIYCTGADGVSRNIGAISESVGEYGSFTMLARPIEAILSSPVQPPSAPRTLGSHSLAGPLTVSGVGPAVGRALVGAARKAGRALISSPAMTRAAAFPPQPLIPGASVAVGLTSGAVAIGAAGTIAYAEGNDVWAFGHDFEGSGRRSLFLEDAYVHAVINNPINAAEVSTYKLATPGNDVGTVTGDGLTAVTGRLGALPVNFPLRLTVRDLDTGHVGSSVTRIADEGDVGRPSGPGVLGLASASAVADTVTSVLNGGPSRQSGDMCVVVRLRELTDPARFCNTYTVDGAGANFMAGALITDVTSAMTLLDSYRFGALHPAGIDVGIRIRRGVRQAFLLGASAHGSARGGHAFAVRLRLRLLSTGRIVRRTIRFRFPRGIRAGVRVLRLAGSPGDVGGDPLDDSSFSVVFGEDPADDPDARGAESPEELAAAIRALHRPDGVTAKIGGSERAVYRDPQLRISGSASVRVRIRRGGH